MPDDLKATLKKIPPTAWAIMGGVVLVAVLAAKKGGGTTTQQIPVYPQMVTPEATGATTAPATSGGTFDPSAINNAIQSLGTNLAGALAAQQTATQAAITAMGQSQEANNKYLAGLIAAGAHDPTTPTSPGGPAITPYATNVTQMNTTPTALHAGISQLSNLSNAWNASGGADDTPERLAIHNQANQVRAWMLQQGVNPADVPRQYWGNTTTAFEVA